MKTYIVQKDVLNSIFAQVARCRSKGKFKARLITFNASDSVLIREGGDTKSHNDTLDSKEVKGLRYVARVKAVAVKNSDCLPLRIFRVSLTDHMTNCLKISLPWPIRSNLITSVVDEHKVEQ